MGKRTLLLVLGLTACKGLIELPKTAPSATVKPTDPTVPVVTLPTINTCASEGSGTPARMRLLWQDAYLAELSARLGPGAAAAASAKVGLSVPTNKTFRFDAAGSLLTPDAVSTLADAADAVAVWALSTDANASSVFGCNARTLTGSAAETCFTNFLNTTGTRLLRRPLSSAEVDDTLAFFRTEVAAGDGTSSQEGFRQGLASLLVHPDFLYLRDRTTSKTSSTIDTYALASRVSFALLGKGPDDALYAAAADGTLADPEVMKAQVARLLATQEARAEAAHFYRQWLGYDLLPQPAYSAAFLGGLDLTGYHDAALDELDTFMVGLTFDRHAAPNDLLTSTFLPPVPAALSAIYGTAPGAQSVNADRAGFLTRAGMLSSGSDNWSIVGRGVPLLRNVLCQPLQPPANVDVGAAAAQAAMLKVSFRDRFDSITAPAGCQTCHHRINPLGAAQSDFDAVGRKISTEVHYAGGMFDFQVPVNAQVDVSSDLGTGVMVNGGVALSNAVAESNQFGACFANRFVAKSLGRLESADGCVAVAAQKAIDAHGSILDAMQAAFASPDFATWHE
ncbi:MAG: DUF1592 domain-containing protein [Myxococcaceae bacterium]